MSPVWALPPNSVTTPDPASPPASQPLLLPELLPLDDPLLPPEPLPELLPELLALPELLPELLPLLLPDPLIPSDVTSPPASTVLFPDELPQSMVFTDTRASDAAPTTKEPQ